MPKLRAATLDRLEVTIADRKANDSGVLTIKDYRLMWKPKGKSTTHIVTLKKFTDWIIQEGRESKRL